MINLIKNAFFDSKSFKKFEYSHATNLGFNFFLIDLCLEMKLYNILYNQKVSNFQSDVNLNVFKLKCPTIKISILDYILKLKLLS